MDPVGADGARVGLAGTILAPVIPDRTSPHANFLNAPALSYACYCKRPAAGTVAWEQGHYFFAFPRPEQKSQAHLMVDVEGEREVVMLHPEDGSPYRRQNKPLHELFALNFWGRSVIDDAHGDSEPRNVACGLISSGKFSLTLKSATFKPGRASHFKRPDGTPYEEGETPEFAYSPTGTEFSGTAGQPTVRDLDIQDISGYSGSLEYLYAPIHCQAVALMILAQDWIRLGRWLKQISSLGFGASELMRRIMEQNPAALGSADAEHRAPAPSTGRTQTAMDPTEAPRGAPRGSFPGVPGTSGALPVADLSRGNHLGQVTDDEGGTA